MRNEYLRSPNSYAYLLRKYRQRAGLTQKGLAALTKKQVSARTIGDIECGIAYSSHNPTAKALVDALGLWGAERKNFMKAARQNAVRKPHGTTEGIRNSNSEGTQGERSDKWDEQVFEPKSLVLTPAVVTRPVPAMTQGKQKLIAALSISYILDLMEENVATARRTRMLGALGPALELVENVDMRLGETIPSFPGTLSDQDRAYRIFTRALFEQLRIYTVITSKEEASEKLWKVAAKLDRLVGLCEEAGLYQRAQEAKSFSKHTSAILYNIAEEHYQSILCNQEVNPSSVEDDIRLELEIELLRNSAVSYGRIGEKGEFDKVKGQLLTLLNSGRCEDLGLLCFGYEGLGRGSALLGIEQQAYDMLDEGWRIHNQIRKQGNKEPLRTMQLYRGQLMAVKRFETAYPNTIVEIGERALAVAKEYSYPRHQHQIMSMLQN